MTYNTYFPLRFIVVQLMGLFPLNKIVNIIKFLSASWVKYQSEKAEVLEERAKGQGPFIWSWSWKPIGCRPLELIWSSFRVINQKAEMIPIKSTNRPARGLSVREDRCTCVSIKPSTTRCLQSRPERQPGEYLMKWLVFCATACRCWEVTWWQAAYFPSNHCE